MITFKQTGNFDKFNTTMEQFLSVIRMSELDKYGRLGVEALREATPKRTGRTANSWTYHIERTMDSATIVWENTNIHNGENIALLIQYGHGTGKGVYVQGRDYINPAIQPIFNQIEQEAWKEVENC